MGDFTILTCGASAAGSPLLAQSRLATPDIIRLCEILKGSFHRYLNAYVTGGIETLRQRDHYRAQSELAPHRSILKAYLEQHPPATLAEQAAITAERRGVVRKPTEVRILLRALGLQPMKVGMIPVKADVEAQEGLEKSLELRLEEAKTCQPTHQFKSD